MDSSYKTNYAQYDSVFKIWETKKAITIDKKDKGLSYLFFALPLTARNHLRLISMTSASHEFVKTILSCKMLKGKKRKSDQAKNLSLLHPVK